MPDAQTKTPPGDGGPVDWRLPGTGLGVRITGVTPPQLAEHLSNLRFVPHPPDGDLPSVRVSYLAPTAPRGDPAPRIHQYDGRVELQVADGVVSISEGEPSCDLALAADVVLDEPVAAGIALFRAFALQDAIWTHALAFEYAGRSVLALGPSYSGKSTLAAALIAAGGRLVSDDSVLVHATAGDRPTAHCLRDFMRVRQPSEQLLPASIRRHLHPSERKDSWTLELATLDDHRRLATTPDTLWLLDATEDARPFTSSVRTATQSEALSHWIDATIPCFFHSTWPDERRRLLAMVSRFVADAELHAISFGHDLMSAPQATLDGAIDAKASQNSLPGAR